MKDCGTIGRPKKSSKFFVEDQINMEKSSALLLSDCDGTDDKMLGFASSTEGASSAERSISHFDAQSSEFPAVSWSRTIALLQENTNMQFLDAEIPSPLQSLLRSTSDFSFGDCSLFGQSVLVSGNEKDFKDFISF
jgi:hypothetical protein